MSNVVWFISYKLVKGASVPDFLRASERVNNEILSKQKGFISWKVLVDGDTWVDLVIWESMDDAKNGETAGKTNPVAHEFYSFIDLESCKHQLFFVEKSYQFGKGSK